MKQGTTRSAILVTRARWLVRGFAILGVLVMLGIGVNYIVELHKAQSAVIPQGLTIGAVAWEHLSPGIFVSLGLYALMFAVAQMGMTVLQMMQTHELFQRADAQLRTL